MRQVSYTIRAGLMAAPDPLDPSAQLYDTSVALHDGSESQAWRKFAMKRGKRLETKHMHDLKACGMLCLQHAAR